MHPQSPGHATVESQPGAQGMSGAPGKGAEVNDRTLPREVVPGDPVQEARFVAANHARDGIDGCQVRDAGAPRLRRAAKKQRFAQLVGALRGRLQPDGRRSFHVPSPGSAAWFSG
jgi:hypothetical protein